MTMLQARQRHPPRDLKAVEATIRRLRRARMPSIRGISRRELRAIKRYTLEYDPDTWEQIARRRGVLSYALLLHEQAEMRYYDQQGVNPFQEQEWAALYEEAHAHALHVEHKFLQRVAENKGYRGLNPGTLVARNTSVRPLTREEDVRIIQRFWNRKDAEIVESAFETADTFYEEVMAEWV